MSLIIEQWFCFLKNLFFDVNTDIIVGEMIWYLDFALKYSGKVLEGGWWNKMTKLVVVEAGQNHLKSSIIKSWQKIEHSHMHVHNQVLF